MRVSIPVLISLALCLAACGKSSQNPPAPAATTAPAASSAATASTAPAASSAAAPGTSAAAASATTVAPDEATTAGPEVAGQVALAQGSVTDTAKDGSSRALKDGDNVYPGDSFVLGADSYLDLDLEDTGRILLRPNTSFQIQSYHYEPDAHDPSAPTDANGQPLIKPQQPENAFFRLVKGGLRAIDGVIGHTSPQSYGVETPVATIGVRGTAFDVRYCGDDCTDEADAGGKPDNGLYTSVSEGSVDVKNDDGDVVTPAGHAGFVKSRKQRMQALAAPPKALRHMDLPEKLKPRANQNRGNLRVKRQKRRQLILQHRAAAKAKAGAQAKPAGAALKPGAKGPKPGTPAERRERRKEKLQEQRKGGAQPAPAAVSKGKAERLKQRGDKLRQQERGPGRAAPANGTLKPGAQGSEGGATPREQLREKGQERRQGKQQQADKPARGTAAAPAAAKKDKADKPSADDKCKDKKKRKKADKDKDKCGGD